MKRILQRSLKLFITGALLGAILSLSTIAIQNKYQATRPVAAKQNTHATTKPKEPATPEDFQPIIAEYRDSVVKIEGEACDYIVDGSGFIIGQDLVATNAHAVAGMKKPNVIDTHGKHKGTIVFFDPILDVAIIRVSGLTGRPFKLDTPSNGLALQDSHYGKQSVVMGYPDGGSLQSQFVDIGEEFTAITADIYGQPQALEHDLFALHTEVVPGSSGSPVVQVDGTVAGIVFAVDPTVKNKGLALPTHVFYGEIKKAEQLHDAVDTSKCAVLDVE